MLTLSLSLSVAIPWYSTTMIILFIVYWNCGLNVYQNRTEIRQRIREWSEYVSIRYRVTSNMRLPLRGLDARRLCSCHIQWIANGNPQPKKDVSWPHWPITSFYCTLHCTAPLTYDSAIISAACIQLWRSPCNVKRGSYQNTYNIIYSISIKYDILLTTEM